MALTFGLPSVVQDNNRAPLTFGESIGKAPSPGSQWGAGALPFSLGTPVGSQQQQQRATAGGVNTTQVDGQSSFVDGLAGFGGALLQGIGVRPERQQNGPQPAMWGQQSDQSAGGIDWQMIVVVGLVGVGVYYAFR